MNLVKKRKYIWILIIAIVFLSGCSEEQTEFICPNGSTVSNLSLCVTNEVKTNCEDCIEGQCISENGSYYFCEKNQTNCNQLTLVYSCPEGYNYSNNKCSNSENTIEFISYDSMKSEIGGFGEDTSFEITRDTRNVSGKVIKLYKGRCSVINYSEKTQEPNEYILNCSDNCNRGVVIEFQRHVKLSENYFTDGFALRLLNNNTRNCSMYCIVHDGAAFRSNGNYINNNIFKLSLDEEEIISLKTTAPGNLSLICSEEDDSGNNCEYTIDQEFLTEPL